MSIRARDKNGLQLPLSSYKKLKAFHSGGYFWDPLPQSLIRQYLGEYLPPVEVAAENGDSMGWFRRFCDGKEVLYLSKPLGGRAIPQGQLDQLRSQFAALKSAADARDTQQHNRELISQFRLPHPEKDPELYRIRGPVWNRHLEILWGCEKVEDSSLAPPDALGLLRADRFYTLRRWFLGLLAALLAILLLWGIWCLFKEAYARIINKAPVSAAVLHTDDLKGRVVSVDGLGNSSDPDGRVVANTIDWGDGTKEVVPAGRLKATKTYGKDGDYEITVRAVDNLGKESAPRTMPVKLDNERRQMAAEAERKRVAEMGRAEQLAEKKRAAEEAARAEAEKKVIEEAAEKARQEAAIAMTRRLAEEAERAEANRKAQAAKIEEERQAAEAQRKAQAAKQEDARRAAEAELRAKQQAGAQQYNSELAASNPGTGSTAKQKATEGGSPVEPSEFKDVSTGRPVRPISFKKPSYPRQALQANEEGSVRVQFTVDTNGLTKDIKVIGDRNGYYFKPAVVDAIRKATFQPAIIDGAPIEQQLAYEISFVISKD